MTIQQPIRLADHVSIPPRYLTRHVGIFGATGTGKTSTAATVARALSCPVLILDAKGDLGGLGNRLLPWRDAQLSVEGMGADALTRALDLSDAQSGALHIALAWAQDRGVHVHTLQQLRTVLNGAFTSPEIGLYGLLSGASIAAVQRSILRLDRGCPWAFGPVTLDPLARSGVSVLQCADLAAVPGLYSAFVADLLGRLYDRLTECGDVGAAGLVVMIDESHLVFSDSPAPVVRRIEQVVRLIRSKGVGLVFISQSPADLPDAILGQLASRIQHGLRAATPRQQAAARVAAETLPGNFTAADVLALGTGQALVSVPDAAGIPKPATVCNVVFSGVPPSPLESPPDPAPVIRFVPMPESVNSESPLHFPDAGPVRGMSLGMRRVIWGCGWLYGLTFLASLFT